MMAPTHVVFCVILALSATAAEAQSARIHTYANPLDIDYRYNHEARERGRSYRAGADPVIVHHPTGYYLFETLAGGYWRSPDLVRWHFVMPSQWPAGDIVAPAALTVGDTIFLIRAATAPQPIYYTTAPATGRLEIYNPMLPPLPFAVLQGTERAGQLVAPDSVQPGPWDPALFRDEDGRWFLFWGSSNAYPIYGLELDPAHRLAYRPGAHPIHLLSLHPDVHGWERFGPDHQDTIRPFIEGAWMTKHGGRYYLQYAAPGTEYNVYANGTYIGSAPLGPFAYAPYNPVSYKPGGFVVGAGHGNTFRDAYGNWWNTGTPWIGVNENWERRIALFPAGFDADGQMFADTRFGDFPHYVPTRRWTRSHELFTGWMLLSYRRPVTASSVRDTFRAASVTDENPRTFWVAGGNRPGEWVRLDLGRVFDVRAVQVNYGDYQSGLFANDSSVYTQFRLSASVDGRRWFRVADLTGERRDRPNAYIELTHPVRARYVRYEHVHVGAANLAISDIRVFGRGGGAAPRAPRGLSARRDADARNAFVSWQPVRDAVGYNVLWGIRPEKLYQTYQRFADQGTTFELRALTAGQDYWFAVEAFDENGVSPRSGVAHVR